jgi:NAD(P)H-hydrate epimerase
MATAGSGDVLSAVIAAFAARGFDIFEAAKFGAYVHGLAGELAQKEKGENGVIASDICEYVPYVLKQIINKRQ